MRHSRNRAVLIALLVGGLSTGCAALTNPAADGVPARLVPPELLAPPREGSHTIPLEMLGQPQPDAYRLGPGDVLGVHVEGHLSAPNQLIPLHVNPPVQLREQRRLPPAAGYPVEVQADGTVVLPRVPPLPVVGMTLAQARDAVRALYVRQGLLKAEKREEVPVFVTLLQPRQASVVVLRQEAPSFIGGPDGSIPAGKRGTGHLVDLPGYENDVLHALALTGGLPGLDAYNAIVVRRGCFRSGAEGALIVNQAQTSPQGLLPPALDQREVRIPLRIPPGHPLPLKPEDVVLRSGDVVFLEARDEEVFYTGGLLPSGVQVLPRDIDLDVIEAIAQVRGPLINGAFGGSNLSGALIQSGIGNPSPTQLTVLRRTPGGGQVPIIVDVAKALRDPSERILVRGGDVLLLQEKPEEALTRYVTQTFFNFNLAWQVIHERFATGIIDVSTPDRLPNNRLPNLTINR